MKVPKKPQVSMRGATYRKLREEAQRRGVTMTELLDLLCNEWLDSAECDRREVPDV